MLYFAKSYRSCTKYCFSKENEWACDGDLDSTFHVWLQLLSCACLDSFSSKYHSYLQKQILLISKKLASFCPLFDLQLSSCLRSAIIVCHEYGLEIIWFIDFLLNFICSSLFSIFIFHSFLKYKIQLYLISFSLPKSTIMLLLTHFSHSVFSAFVGHFVVW